MCQAVTVKDLPYGAGPLPPHSLAPPSQFKLMGGLGETAQLGETTQISNHTY